MSFSKDFSCCTLPGSLSLSAAAAGAAVNPNKPRRIAIAAGHGLFMGRLLVVSVSLYQRPDDTRRPAGCALFFGVRCPISGAPAEREESLRRGWPRLEWSLPSRALPENAVLS